MQAQQALAVPTRSFSLVIAVVATLVAAALALALVAGVRPAAVHEASSVVVTHQQAPDAMERTMALAALQPIQHGQAPDAKDRNESLSRGR